MRKCPLCHREKDLNDAHIKSCKMSTSVDRPLHEKIDPAKWDALYAGPKKVSRKR